MRSRGAGGGVGGASDPGHALDAHEAETALDALSRGLQALARDLASFSGVVERMRGAIGPAGAAPAAGGAPGGAGWPSGSGLPAKSGRPNLRGRRGPAIGSGGRGPVVEGFGEVPSGPPTSGPWADPAAPGNELLRKLHESESKLLSRVGSGRPAYGPGSEPPADAAGSAPGVLGGVGGKGGFHLTLNFSLGAGSERELRHDILLIVDEELSRVFSTPRRR